MTFAPFSFEGGLGGKYRHPNQTASGNPAQASYHPYTGTTQALFTSAIGTHNTSFSIPDPLESAGISAGEIVGHRCWELGRDGLLYSVFVATKWHPREVMRFPGDHIHDYGQTGFHAFKAKHQLMAEYGVKFFTHNFLVYGTVNLWGKVIEHDYGYRAEYAAIRSLDLILRGEYVIGDIPMREAELNRLRELYGVGDET